MGDSRTRCQLESTQVPWPYNSPLLPVGYTYRGMRQIKRPQDVKFLWPGDLRCPGAGKHLLSHVHVGVAHHHADAVALAHWTTKGHSYCCRACGHGPRCRVQGTPASRPERSEVRGGYASWRCFPSGADSVAPSLARRRKAGSSNNGSGDKNHCLTHNSLHRVTRAGAGTLLIGSRRACVLGWW